MGQTLKYDILSIQERADNAKKEGKKVVCGCAGMLFNEDKELGTYKVINAALKSNLTNYLAYPSVIGSSEYKQGVLNWVFGNKLEEIKKRFAIPFCATLGGTGAVSFAFKHEKRENNGSVVIADIHWPNYENIASEADIELVTHEMLDENNQYNFADLQEKIDDLLIKYPSVLFVLNDPCQNPSGYCFTKDEYIKLFNLLNSYEGKVKLLLDIAYLDYAPMGFLFIPILLNFDVKFNISIAFSCSKSFGVYGLRLGAIFDLADKNSNFDDKQYFYRMLARSTYSCPNGAAIGPIAEVLNDSHRVDRLRKNIKKECERISEVGKRLIKFLDRKGIQHLPYYGGFFLVIKVDDAIKTIQELEAKDIYFAYINPNLIRIAVASLTLQDLKELERRLA